MVDVEAGLKYPIRGDGTLKRFAVFGSAPLAMYVLTLAVAIASVAVPALGALQLLLLPMQLGIAVLWLGYFVQVARDTFAGGTEPPAVADWGQLARDGLGGLAVVLAYYVPVIAVTLVGYVVVALLLLGAGFGVEQGSESVAATAGVLGGVGVLVLMFVVSLSSLAMAYLLPISIAAYADEGRLGAAFSLDTLLTVGRHGDYVKPWAATFGVYVLVATVLGFLAMLLVGIVLLPFAYFYVGLAGFHMFAQGYASATGMTVPAGTIEGGPTTERAGGTPRRAPEDV